MRASDMINDVTKEVQCRIDQLYAAIGTPAPDSALDQIGLRDGADTVRNYLQHGEEGLAFDHLIYMISEPEVEITASSYEKLTRAGKLLGIPPEAWSTVRHSMSEQRNWNESYREGDLPWDTGKPSSELQRIVSQHKIQPGLTLELGCGTGTNSVWLAQQGFEVTGVDVAPLAVERADERARAAGVQAHFLVADVLNLPDLGGPFAFFFDRGCYHAVRQIAPREYAPAVAQQLAPGARGLILAGNAKEPHEPGPPVVTEEEIRDELGSTFEILELREFRFDEAPGVDERFLAWSCLIENR